MEILEAILLDQSMRTFSKPGPPLLQGRGWSVCVCGGGRCWQDSEMGDGGALGGDSHKQGPLCHQPKATSNGRYLV